MQKYVVTDQPLNIPPGDRVGLTRQQWNDRVHNTVVIDTVGKDLVIVDAINMLQFKVGETIQLDGLPDKATAESLATTKGVAATDLIAAESAKADADAAAQRAAADAASAKAKADADAAAAADQARADAKAKLDLATSAAADAQAALAAAKSDADKAAAQVKLDAAKQAVAEAQTAAAALAG